MTQPTPTKDTCPAWAIELILTLRQMEIQLGNVLESPKDKGDEYVTKSFADLIQENLDVTESATETLFATIVTRLSEAGFPSQDIAQFINARVAPGSKLPYCDTKEVEAAVGKA